MHGGTLLCEQMGFLESSTSPTPVPPRAAGNVEEPEDGSFWPPEGTLEPGEQEGALSWAFLPETQPQLDVGRGSGNALGERAR